MNDYLNNLAARTLNLAPVVKPRLASLFEPVSAATRHVGRVLFEGERENPATTESISGITHVSPIASRDDAIRPARAPEPTSRVGDRAIASDNQSDLQVGLVETIIQHPTVTSPAPPFDISSQVSERDSVRLGWLRPQAHEPYDVQDNSLQFADGEIKGNEVTPSRGPTLRNIAAGYIDQTEAPGPDERARIHPTIAQSTQGSHAAIAVIEPNSVSTTPTRAAFAESSRPGDMPSTISVTIGRVDVRAVFSQPSVPRVNRAQQPAAMSLTEYLKQRSEGHR